MIVLEVGPGPALGRVGPLRLGEALCLWNDKLEGHGVALGRASAVGMVRTGAWGGGGGMELADGTSSGAGPDAGPEVAMLFEPMGDLLCVS